MTVIIPWVPFGITGIVSWSIWALRQFRSRWGCREIVNDYRTTTSLVVPVYKEDGDVLERCLRTWLVQDPTEVILVVDDLDDVILDRLHRLNRPTVQVLPWRHTGKGGAMGVGVRAATCEVVVFADSDTSWRPGLLDAVQMPFADPKVGGVGTRQHVYMPRSALCRQVAYWLLNTRYLDYVPAMSHRGGVACLSGRTAAYRRAVIVPLTPALEHEIFLGKECVAGDDGRLTWLTRAAGYRTVHQGRAKADSMFPNSWTVFLRQRVRWSRNSYRCYLTAFAQGWLFTQPLVTWSAPPKPTYPFPDRVEAVAPTLVVSITGDPTTPYDAGIRLAEALGGSLLTVEGEQHTVVAAGKNACVAGLAAAYLIDLRTRRPTPAAPSDRPGET